MFAEDSNNEKSELAHLMALRQTSDKQFYIHIRVIFKTICICQWADAYIRHLSSMI